MRLSGQAVGENVGQNFGLPNRRRLEIAPGKINLSPIPLLEGEVPRDAEGAVLARLTDEEAQVWLRGRLEAGVPPERPRTTRNRGYDDALFDHPEEQGRDAGIEQLFVLTTQTAHWFLDRGFVQGRVEDLPVAKRELYNYQRGSKVFIEPVGALSDLER